jgi:type IV pilus assembly protein PilN
MIRVNLIGEERRKRRKKPLQIKNFNLIFIVVIVLTILINGGAFGYLYFTVSGLEEEKKKNEKTIAELNKLIAEVKRFEELNKEINNRKTIIQGLTKNKTIPVRILNEINATLPDGLWLTKIGYKGNTVDMEGMALTNLAVVSFIENLKGSRVANNPYLKETNQIEYQKVPVYRFSLSFGVNV